MDHIQEGMSAGRPTTCYPTPRASMGATSSMRPQRRAGFIDYDKVVQFPFGRGLSYTTFTQTMSDLSVANGEITFDVTVTNTGSTAGKDMASSSTSWARAATCWSRGTTSFLLTPIPMRCWTTKPTTRTATWSTMKRTMHAIQISRKKELVIIQARENRGILVVSAPMELDMLEAGTSETVELTSARVRKTPSPA